MDYTREMFLRQLNTRFLFASGAAPGCDGNQRSGNPNTAGNDEQRGDNHKGNYE